MLSATGWRLIARSSSIASWFSTAGSRPRTTAPNAAFPADWRRLDLDEAIAVAGGTIYVPRRLLTRDDAQLMPSSWRMPWDTLRFVIHPGMTLGELAQGRSAGCQPNRSRRGSAERVKAVALKRFAFDRACEIEADGYSGKASDG